MVSTQDRPLVAADPPDGLVLDTTGSDHLHGGEPAMLSSMVHGLAEAGFRAKAAVADSWGAAHALARYGRGSVIIVPPGETQAILADLPIKALRLSPSIVAELATLGVAHIGTLAAMPRAPSPCASAARLPTAWIRLLDIQMKSLRPYVL